MTIRAFVIPVSDTPLREVTVGTDWTELAEAIDCTYIQKVSICSSPEPLPLLSSPSLFVDEEAALKQGSHINFRASCLFGMKHHQQVLRGPVLMVWANVHTGSLMDAPVGVDYQWIYSMIENRRYPHGK